MALTDEERNGVAASLDRCDAALAGKPTLGRVFDRTWRTDFRKQVLAADSLVDAAFPEAYYAPCLDLPPDYQQRIEEGASILLAKLDARAWKDFVSRIQGRESASALEELLLVRGFTQELGTIELPLGNRAMPRPEFTVAIEGHQIAVEARGLMNSRNVQQLNDDSWRFGQHYWISADAAIGDPARVRKALAEKMLESSDGSPRITVLTLYSAFDFENARDTAREMALRPASFNIPQEKYPLAVGLALHRLLQGIWFNDSVVQRLGFSAEIKERIRTAIKNSLYPRQDGVSLTDDDNC
jgi:hypothetical protein